MKNKLFTLSLMAIVMTGLASCGDNASDDATINYLGVGAYDGVYIAKSKGFFDEEGVKVEVAKQQAGGAEACRLVNTGDYQAGQSNVWAIAQSIDKGFHIKGVADFQSCFDDTPLERMIVRKDSGIKSVKDLKGKKIAVNMIGGSFYYTWEEMLKKNDMSLDDVEMSVLAFPAQQQALESGQIDCISVLTPYSSSALADEDNVTLFTDYDTFGQTQFCQIFMNTDFTSAHPEESKKFVTALAKADDWAMSHQEEAKEIIEEWTGISKDLIFDYRFQEHGMCQMDAMDYYLDYLGLGDKYKASDICTNEFNELVK